MHPRIQSPTEQSPPQFSQMSPPSSFPDYSPNSCSLFPGIKHRTFVTIPCTTMQWRGRFRYPLLRSTLIAIRPLSPTLLALCCRLTTNRRTLRYAWLRKITGAPPPCLAIGSWSNWHDYISMAPAPEPTSAFFGANLVAGRQLQQFWTSA
ncbi:hypothetical protein OsI_11894 [Oryza sativa Indica Group]|uniref:Uncharacterized protein n=1 Tax=Oryza sativa subsp. indica TaxID=39946 RepID=B8AQZ7_ORYSI|nr:hypothetical protein OsI_11894 [Oryza sativa Indica Group]